MTTPTSASLLPSHQDTQTAEHAHEQHAAAAMQQNGTSNDVSTTDVVDRIGNDNVAAPSSSPSPSRGPSPSSIALLSQTPNRLHHQVNKYKRDKERHRRQNIGIRIGTGTGIAVGSRGRIEIGTGTNLQVSPHPQTTTSSNTSSALTWAPTSSTAHHDSHSHYHYHPYHHSHPDAPTHSRRRRSHPYSPNSNSPHRYTHSHGGVSVPASDVRDYLDYLRSLRSLALGATTQHSSELVAAFHSISQQLSLGIQERQLLQQQQAAVNNSFTQQTAAEVVAQPTVPSSHIPPDAAVIPVTETRQPKLQPSTFTDHHPLASQARALETDLHLIDFPSLEQCLRTNIKQGLTLPQVAEKQASDGLNVLTPPPHRSMFLLFLNELISGFGPILWLAALLCFLAWKPFGSQTQTSRQHRKREHPISLRLHSLVTHCCLFCIGCASGCCVGPPDPTNLGLGVIIICVIVLSSCFAFYQTRKSINIINAFVHILPSLAMVRREGKEQQISAQELVVGDIVTVKMGDKVPADLRILSASSLQVNNSALTGESEPVNCTVEASDENLLESSNVCFYSSLVIQGTAVGVVINTGDRTVLGNVSTLTKSDSSHRTNLQKEIHRFVLIICALAISTAIVCFIGWMAWLRVDYPSFLPTAAFLSNVIGLVVAYLPTGLPVSLSLVLTFVAQRMYTQIPGASVVSTGELHSPSLCVFYDLLRAALLCTNVDVLSGQDEEEAQQSENPSSALSVESQALYGDAVDVALYQLCLKYQMNIEAETTKYPRVGLLPFNSKTKLMISVHREQNSDNENRGVEPNHQESPLLIVMKGAPEFVLARCSHMLNDAGLLIPLTPQDAELVTTRQESMGANGYRVIAVARRTASLVNPSHSTLDDFAGLPNHGYSFLGLIAFMDPPREGVAAAVTKSRRAGIRVAMITGDHPSTALAIARQVNIVDQPIPVDRMKVHTDALGRKTMIITRDEHPLFTHTIGFNHSEASLFEPIQTVGHPTGTPLSSMFIPTADSSAVPLQSVMTHDSSDGLSLPGGGCILVTGSDLRVFDSFLWQFVLSHSCMVFARTSPEQKLKIVVECQLRGEIVVVTGDGVNDAPALKRADVGFAMKSGAEVACEAADLILLDNNFVSVVTAIETGRLVSDNLKKVTLYLLPAGSWSELLPVLTNVFLGLPLPLSPFYMVCVCMLTDMAPSLALVNETPEQEIMSRKPVPRASSHLVDWKLLFHAYFLLGMIESFSAYLCYFWYYHEHGIPASGLFLAFDNYTDGYYGKTQSELEELIYTAQSIFFVSLVITQLANVLSTRTRYVSFFSHQPFIGSSKNRSLFLAMLISIVITICITEISWFNDIFHTRPVPVKYVMPALGFGGFLFTFDEIRKRLVQAYPQSWLAAIAW